MCNPVFFVIPFGNLAFNCQWSERCWDFKQEKGGVPDHRRFPSPAKAFSIPFANRARSSQLTTVLPAAPSIPQLTSPSISPFSSPPTPSATTTEPSAPHAIVSGAGSIYSSETFPLSDALDVRARQMQKISDLEARFSEEKLRYHIFEWKCYGKVLDWYPNFEWCRLPSLEDIWKEYAVGSCHRFSLLELESYWEVFKTTPGKPTKKLFSTATRRPRTDDEDTPKMDMEAVKKHMKKEVGDYRHANIEFTEFAIQVLGVTKDDIKALRKGKYAFMTAERIGEYKIATPESRLHAPFLEFAKDLLKEVYQLLGEGEDTLTPAIWDCKGNKKLVQEGRERKPDMLSLWELVALPEWSAVKYIFEFKNPSGQKTSANTHKHIAPPRPFQSDSAAPPTVELEEESEGPSTSGNSKKRKHEDKQEDSRKKPNKVRPDNPDFSEKYQQIAAYGLEAMAATSRYFVVCLAIDKFRITACYMDRFHFLRASSFDFVQEPWKLALVLHGMNICDHQQAGFDPHLRALPSTTIISDGEAIEEPEDCPTQPVKQIAGSHFEFPSVVYESGGSGTQDGKEEKDSENAESGTNDPAPVVLRIDEVLRRPDDLIGRGTTVYKVRLRLKDGSLGEDLYALKVSWAIEKRNAETKIVKEIKRRLSEAAHKHLPNFIFSVTSSAEDLNLPWVKLELPLDDTNFQNRVLRRTVSSFYHPLWEAGGLAQFKKAYIDSVQVHYLAFKLGKALHRDISERNMMVAKLPNSGEVQGILNDWDMAKFVDDANDMLTAAHHRTESTPFLAVDRLAEDAHDTPHWYRHDLESFFYVLLWAMIHYDLTEGKRDILVNSSVIAWTQNSKANSTHKIPIVASNRKLSMKPLFEQVKADFKPLITEWVEPLRRLFYQADNKYQSAVADEEIEEGAELDTYNGMLTFEKFMAAIGCNEGNKDEWAIVPDILEI
ncbi:hypothetical protein NMY22_g12810 [Coprinellus aureogranulatus]|nr:hypothetical protein NMY22_g12810 [Coprinellus aureogranulatus]